jgi:hypothetical protein
MQALVELLIKVEFTHCVFCPKVTGEVIEIVLPINDRVNFKTFSEPEPDTEIKVAFPL